VRRDQRLRARADFARTRTLATRVVKHPLLVLYVAPNQLPRTRLGITVSRRVGKAVTRNLVRRRIREAVRCRLREIASGRDLLFVARPPSAAAGWTAIRDAVEHTIGRAGLRLPANGDGATTATPAHVPSPEGPPQWA